MFSAFLRRSPIPTTTSSLRIAATAIGLALLSSCGTNPTPSTPTSTVEVGSIVLSVPSQIVERGYHTTLTATVRNKQGTIVPVPVAWRSADEKIVTVDGNGRITAVDTGQTVIFATSLGVISQGLPIAVVYTGPAKIVISSFAPVAAISAGVTPDSIHVLLTDIKGKPVTIPTRVAFAVTAGGGTVSPAIGTTDAKGIASAQWKLGPVAGLNTVTATVLAEDDKPSTAITPNFVTFALRTFSPLVVVAGDKQVGQILAPLPQQPSVKLIDSLGKPRPGVPVTFAATSGGKVAFGTVSTGADGVASPGNWTLGDAPGPQSLVATTELASVTLTATGTGTAQHYTPLVVAAGGFATCAIEIDKTVSCFGEEPKVGDSSKVNKKVPTPTYGGVKFTQLAGAPSNPSHFCGVSDDQSLWCWGINVVPDTADTTVFDANIPRKIQSGLAFSQGAPGQAHTCALGTDQNAYCWGDNSQGQLGDRSITRRFGPVAVFGGFKFTSVSAGAGHNCGVTVTGLGVCWGYNANGQVGDGTTNGKVSPTAISGGLAFKGLSAGGFFTCGVATDSKTYCWGLLPGLTAATTPHVYPDAPTFVAISSGGSHVCALTADGSAYCWGQNSAGQLGDSTLVDKPVPTAVATTIKFKSISAGFGHTCGNAIDGSVACWGLNKAGELGDSTALNTSRLVPRQIVLKVIPAATSTNRLVSPPRGTLPLRFGRP